MKISKYLITALFASMFGIASMNVFADVDTDDFIEDASAKNIAEVEAGKLALEKSTNPSVKKFAQKMISDHTASNTSLRSLASKKNVEMADDAELVSQAKEAILKQYDGESFDVAYANNQVKAHKAAIELYQDASKSKDTEVRGYAVAGLTKIQHHLKEAEALVSELAKNSKNIDSEADYEDAE